MSYRVAKSLNVLLAEFNALYPDRSKSWDGALGDTAHAARKSDHNPNSAGVVRARDIDITSVPVAQRQVLADAIVRHMVATGTKGYVIFNGRIANPSIGGGRWRAYHGASPHDHHIHTSVHTHIDSTAAWGLAAAIRAISPVRQRPTGPFPLDVFYPSQDGPWYGMRPEGNTDPRIHDGSKTRDREAIRQIQRYLKGRGAGTADGRAGVKFRAAVKAWKNARRWGEYSGTVTKAVWEAMSTTTEGESK